MKHWAWNGLILLLLVAGLGWAWANRVPAGAADAASLPPAPAIGHPAPDFTLASLSHGDFNLARQRGKPVILNFWATWCPPCRGELPQLQSASQRYAGQVEIVGVDQVEPAATVQALAAQLGLAYTMPLDSAGAASRLYGIRNLPTTFFIDRSGVIRQVQIGPLTEATLADMVRSIYP